MNRKEMDEEIQKRVPSLVEEQGKHWHQSDHLRQDFVNDYPPERILLLALDDFVIGKGPDNRSFCYRLEREMDELGRILGATAFKFGVYYGRTKEDPTMQYRFPKKWGETLEEAFTAVKAEISNLLHAAARQDLPALNANRLSPMFKGKLLFVYFPDEYAPIYSTEHLEYFCAHLHLPTASTSATAMQRALMAYRDTWPELKAHSPVLFMHFLYQLFPEVKHREATTPVEAPLPLLTEATAGACFISQLPPIPPTTPATTRTAPQPKIDYAEQQKQRKHIGDRGEAIVLEMEKKRLRDAGCPDLAERINHVSDTSDQYGYDILSYDVDGTERHIEVKATTAQDPGRGFFISANELETSKTLANYYLYLVFAATSKSPKILPVPSPDFTGPGYELMPVAYHVGIISNHSSGERRP